MAETKSFDVAIVGVDSLLGEALVALLEERQFPIGKLFPLADEDSAGNKVQLNGKFYTAGDIAAFDFSQAQLAFFVAGTHVAAEFAPKAAAAGCVVIDNSECFRLDDEVPLVIPEVNPEELADYRLRNIIASPAADATQMLIALKPIVDAVGVERVNVVTFQAVSEQGKPAVDELASQTVALLNMQTVTHKVFPEQIAFNVLAQTSALEDNGYSRDEMNLLRESQKILSHSAMMINPTTVQVPVFFGHGQVLHIETRNKLTAREAVDLLDSSPGLEVMRGVDAPNPVSDAAGQDGIYVGRLRDDVSRPNGLNLWLVADNVRRDEAKNSVQIAEILVKNHF